MVGLLGLPPELREPIFLDVVLETTEQKPEDPPSAKLSTSYRTMKGPEFDFHESIDRIQCKSLQRHAMPLLHVNQQIRDEVINLVLRHLGHRFDDAIVDVMYAEDRPGSLWATWLSAPFPTIHLHTVHVQIRNFQMFGLRFHDFFDSHQDVSVQEDCHQWLDSQSAVLLLNFLAKSLQKKATYCSIHNSQRVTSAKRIKTANCTIQNLVIDIPFDLDSRRPPEARVRCGYCTRTDSDIPKFNGGVYRMVPSDKRAALVFARCFHEQLMHIFNTVPKSWRANRYSTVILERVGTIDLNVHGRLFRRLDLSKILAKLPLSEDWTRSCPNRAQFVKWKRGAEMKRKTAGFKVSGPSVQEHELAGSSGLIASILAARDESLMREVTLPSDDVAPSARQPAWNEMVHFTGNAVFIQDNGIELPGNATFYSSTATWNQIPLFLYNLQYINPSPRYLTKREREQQALKERRKNGGFVLFKGEAILFHSDAVVSTITSGEATFYGRAEEASTGQSGSIKEDSQTEDHHGTCGTYDTWSSRASSNQGDLATLDWLFQY